MGSGSEQRELGRLVVTGGLSTLGRAIALRLAGHSTSLHVTTSRSEGPHEFDEVYGHLRVPEDLPLGLGLHSADFSLPEGYAFLVESLERGGVDTLVNNAGVHLRRPLAEMTQEHWQRTFAINLFAVAEVTRAAVAGGCTRVVNVVDAGWEKGWPNHSAYLASKAALVSLTRSLAVELAPSVQVNAVAPGIITLPGDAVMTEERMVRRIPAGRVGRPDEIAAAVEALLCSPPYVTGQVLAVDGGYGIR